MKTNGTLTIAACTFALITATLIGVSQARAGGPPAEGIERSQLRRTVDPSPRGPTGSILVQKKNGVQTVLISVRGLGEEEFGGFLDDHPTFDTNCCVHGLAPLDRTNIRRGVWTRKFVGHGIAPPEFQILSIFDVGTLINRGIEISQPGEPNIATTVTNIIGGMTNIVGGVTNIVGTSTNIIFGIPVPVEGQTGTVFSTLWAPLRGISTTPSAFNFSTKAALTLPDGVPPSPSANGIIRIRFNGVQGRSVFDLRVNNLTRGQKYTLWIADSTDQESFTLIPAGEMEMNKAGSQARFIRDTRFGDPLPQQAGNVGELSGRVFRVLDGFFDSHIEGVIP